jgi:hypothetical protein
MKLYDVPRKSYVKISPIQNEESDDTRSKGKYTEVSVPPAHMDMSASQVIFFSHIDGMYSYCHPVDEETMTVNTEIIIHPAAWTEVEIVDPLKGKPFTEIREQIGRSGYGKDGMGEYRQSSLSNMSDNWVAASIDFVPIDHPHRSYYIQELEYRKENNIVIEDTEA